MSSEWAAKRFWTAAHVVAADGGWTIHLDARPVRTPGKAALIVPSQQMAQDIADEWDAQEKLINPLNMPTTCSANSAIDKVTVQHAEVANMLAAYGDADLLCYRAEGPAGLVARQQDAWDPLLDWAAEDMGARLKTRCGIMHAPQSPDALRRLSDLVHQMTAFQLTAFHDLVSLSGSLVLGFAVARGRLSPDAGWTLSRIDETWQEHQWGADEEAQAHALIKQQAFEHAARFFALASSDHSLGNQA